MMNFEISALLINIAIALIVALIALRNSKAAGSISLIVLCIFVTIWSLSYLVYENPKLYLSSQLLIATVFLSSTLSASAQLVFTLSYTNRSRWISRSTLILLSVMPVLTQILFWVQPLHTFFFDNRSPDLANFMPTGLWTRINDIYIYSLVGASVLLLLEIFTHRPRPVLAYAGTILIGAAFPLIPQIVNAIFLFPQLKVDLSIFAFSGAEIAFAYGLLNQKLTRIIPFTREAVVGGMDDGWLVLDAQDAVVDINPAAEKILGISREKAYNQPIGSILGDLPDLGQAFENVREVEMKRSIKSEEGWRYFNIRISSLEDHSRNNFGHLVSWHDITERRQTEDARQRARDEMFVLLNTISSAASDTISLEDFLSEAIYQIVYPFRSHMIGVFLVDERVKKNEEPRLFLASHFGLPPEASGGMEYIYATSQLFSWVNTNRQPLLIEDAKNDLRIPRAMREMDVACLLITPLLIQTSGDNDNKVLGCMFLARKEKPAFSQDEMVRLTTISDHIATLIDGDRRRKLAIALSERQRVLRDLHDSVSQKLYGLVTLTEAAQAGLEAGSAVDPSSVLARIGENARQAVKEMRLFLYQMQPVDIEDEGLVSVLHHRLAAVEGRADIKARLLADDNISLSQDKEVALYFIAQEALNNVLRHARAKSVTVTLKQGRRNVILEVLDDGKGFDYKNVERGGWGLQNMKERASQVSGKIRITSKPDLGTRVIITVEKDHATKIMSKHRERR
ncbi:MAG TPA: histidine kinase N-terminal 7TM domain-containing protein [Anaerolineales bacterium]|jgi:PAS domain S-box-containing protein|nr:histidine kinase N-terminal 7TM domain-containing protein [Anaerolineales bacterium]